MEAHGQHSTSPVPTGAPQTFVFADLAGYTALTEAHGDEHAADVAAEFCAAVRPVLPEFGADEIKRIGDALMLRVPDAGRGVALGLRLLSDLGPRHGALGVRLGMHTGPAVEREGDWYGATVNIASRVAEAAEAGELLATRATLEAAGEAAASVEVVDRGTRRFKHVADPVGVFALRAPGGLVPVRLPVDPVCHMAVDPGLTDHHIIHRGRDHWFCSARCAEAFAAQPERYLHGRRPARLDLLVSDDARGRAARRLTAAYRAGRLDAGELEDRLGRTWSARTRADLQAATQGLPRPRRPWWSAWWRAISRWWRRR